MIGGDVIRDVRETMIELDQLHFTEYGVCLDSTLRDADAPRSA